MILQTDTLKQRTIEEQKSRLIEDVFNEIEKNYSNGERILSFWELNSESSVKYFRIELDDKDSTLGYSLISMITYAVNGVITKNGYKKTPNAYSIFDEIIDSVNNDYNVDYVICMLNETQYLEERMTSENKKIIDTMSNLDHDRIMEIKEQYYRIRKVEEELERMRNTVIPMLLLTTSCIIIYLLFKFLR